MGGQVSTFKAAVNPNGKRVPKPEKKRIEILSFEVANVMSKIILLWQSMSEQEILRLRTDVIKAEGVLNLVSDNEAELLRLACTEKLRDLKAMAGAVSRLGKKCHDPFLQKFEHVYAEVLKQRILAREFLIKDMDGKVKKMEQYINSTSGLYQEMEMFAELQGAMRRMEEDGPGNARDRDTISALGEKAGWHKQEIKYLKDVSLWNCTFDKIVALLARAVCTIHARIVSVFGSPMLGSPQIFPGEMLRDIHSSPLKTGVSLFNISQRRPPEKVSQSGPLLTSFNPLLSHDRAFADTAVTNSNSSSEAAQLSASLPNSHTLNRQDLGSGPAIYQAKTPGVSNGPRHRTTGTLDDLAIPRRNYFDTPAASARSVAGGPYSEFTGTNRSARNSSQPLAASRFHSADLGPDLFSQQRQTKRGNNDPKTRSNSAPSPTLGEVALALHYANVIIVVEKMIKFPHLISQDSREDLYHMLPKSVRTALRSRLRAAYKRAGGFDADVAGDWKDALERILVWLTPLAHNMIRWQSEHNFEQQQLVTRSNMLLLQTLYFADLAKTEAAITELLVGLNYISGHEREKASMPVVADYDNKMVEEYLEWRF